MRTLGLLTEGQSVLQASARSSGGDADVWVYDSRGHGDAPIEFDTGEEHLGRMGLPMRRSQGLSETLAHSRHSHSPFRAHPPP